MKRDVWWFQPRAVAQVLEEWKNGSKVVLVSPPGSGKTEMTKQIRDRVNPKRMIGITSSLGTQRNFERRLGIETFTVQELLLKGGIPGNDKPDVVVWDECHHSAGETWGTVLDFVPKKARLLGLTGTPQRADGKPLDRFDVCVVGAHYSELLMAGTIVPWRCLVPKVFQGTSDPEPAQAYIRYGEGRKALFYCKSLAEADAVTATLWKRKISAAVWHSEIPWKGKEGREARLRAFERGALDCLVTVAALTEGVDVPDASCIVLSARCAFPTKYLQITGRAGRRSKGKTDSLLIDLVAAHRRHGVPTEDRLYSISGGIQRQSRADKGYYYERGPKSEVERGTHDAELVVGYDWRAPTRDDKRNQLGWLVQVAGQRGWGREVAEDAFTQLFGEAPPKAVRGVDDGTEKKRAAG